jgi:hypothetical protein
MTHILKTRWQLLVLVLSLLASIISAPLRAQEPFAQEPLADEAAAALDAAAAPAAAEGTADADLAAVETDPTIRAALELPRVTPADHLQAVLWLIDLDRPRLARPILDELTKMNFTDEQRAELLAKFGSHNMVKLARTKELAPAGGQFADACLATAKKVSTEPQHLAALVKQLSDSSPEERLMARNDLAVTGQIGANATLEALAREKDPNARAALMAAAQQMTPLVERPLLAMLATRDNTLRSDVAALLERLHVPQAAPLLAGYGEAEQALEIALARYSQGTIPFAPDADDQVELWYWSDATKKLSSRKFPADDAQIIWMSRFARTLAQLRPDVTSYQRRALLLDLEAIGVLADSPAAAAQSPVAKQLIETTETHMLEDVLADALKRDYAYAAVAAANAMGERRDPSVLYSGGAQAAPLANALVHKNRRVRNAALQAIMAIDPQGPFPGASRVPEALAWFAGSKGQRRALVAMPTNVSAADLGGKLAEHGFSAAVTNSGREAVKLAGDLTDLEIILLDMNIQAPGVRQVLFEMRMTPGAGDLPVALLARAGRLEAAKQLASEHQRVIAVSRPQSPGVVTSIVEGLAAQARRDTVPAAERAAQAVQATTWLAKLLAVPHSFYDLRRASPEIEDALYSPETTRPAISALAALGTPQSQRALLDFIGQPSFPMASRQLAADAFAASVGKFGTLLTTDEIEAQYARYNASEHADEATQQVYGSVLDAIEAGRTAQDSAPPAP